MCPRIGRSLIPNITLRNKTNTKGDQMTRKNTAAISGKCIAVYVCNFQGPWQVHPKKTQV